MRESQVFWVEFKANGVRQRVEERGFGAATAYAEMVHRVEGCKVWIRRPGGRRKVLAAS